MQPLAWIQVMKRWSPSPATIRWRLKPGVHLLLIAPCAGLLYRLFTGELGINPVEELTHETGEWSLRLLLATLAVTPLRSLTGMVWLTQFRRMLGLYCFLYAVCHFIVYFLLDQNLSLILVFEDVLERPYITVGFTAFCVLIPLALTSTRKARVRLKQLWNRLHQLIYLVGGLALLHFFWLTKADYRSPLVYLMIFALLMLPRIRSWMKTRVR